MAGSGSYTTDHETIRRWVEKRGGHPARVKRRTRGDGGILRIDFPGYSGEKTLEEIDWDTFFDTFDENELAFVFQDKTARGQVSRFNKIIGRDTMMARERGIKTSRHHPARATRKKATTTTRRAATRRKTTRKATRKTAKRRS